MKFFRLNFVIKFLGLISLSILLLNIVNQSLYVHSHKLETGEIVTHAHPFDQQNDNSPLKSHKHTSLEYLVLRSFSVFMLNDILFVIAAFIIIAFNKNYGLKTVIKQFHFYYKQNKSPPFLNSF